VSRATSATIHTDALRHNLQLIRRRAPGSKVMAVVKADGYGHGLERVARALQGADAFGVAALSDAERLRAAGLSQRIVLLSGPDEPDDLALLRRLQVDAVIHHPSQLQLLAADPGGAPIRTWLKLDTGMHRLGFPAADAAEVHARLRALPGVHDEIVLMTHFARSDEFTSAATREQMRRFDEAVAGLPGEHSLSNSAGVLGWPEAHRHWVRPGGALYGYGGTPKPPFAHVASFKTRVAAVNAYPAGDTVSYDRTFTLKRDSLLANLPVGYSDGYRRAYSNKGAVLVRGQRAPVVGNVTMNTTMVDVTDIPGVQAGDEVVLFGKQGEAQITQAEIEELTGVVLADQYTIWGNSNPKILRR